MPRTNKRSFSSKAQRRSTRQRRRTSRTTKTRRQSSRVSRGGSFNRTDLESLEHSVLVRKENKGRDLVGKVIHIEGEGFGLVYGMNTGLGSTTTHNVMFFSEGANNTW